MTVKTTSGSGQAHNISVHVPPSIMVNVLQGINQAIYSHVIDRNKQTHSILRLELVRCVTTYESFAHSKIDARWGDKCMNTVLPNGVKWFN